MEDYLWIIKAKDYLLVADVINPWLLKENQKTCRNILIYFLERKRERVEEEEDEMPREGDEGDGCDGG